MPQQQNRKRNYQQIDTLKGLAIIAVIVLHSLSKPALLKSFAVYHIWQAVPLFMVLMGLNLRLSLKPIPFSDLYTKAYFRKKATRILIPFLLVFCASILLGLLWEPLLGRDVLQFSGYTLVGVLPVPGRGNYFITLLLQSILVLPLLGYCFTKRPVLTTVALLLMEVLFLLLSKHYQLFDKEAYMYSAALPRYFTALAYGLWLAKAIRQPLSRGALFAFAIAGGVGAVYLYFGATGGLEIPQVYDSWEKQNVLSFGYAAMLVLLGIYILPTASENPSLKLLAGLGQASYHIFLAQVLYFGLASENDNLFLNMAVCLPAGYLFYRLETRLSARR
ncbi:acyltransferase family protein [Pontibacter sp. CAU 1760]